MSTAGLDTSRASSPRSSLTTAKARCDGSGLQKVFALQYRIQHRRRFLRFWLQVPGIDSTTLFMKAIEHGVAFVTGPSFFVDGSGLDFMRTCFTFAQPEELEGAKRLGAIIKAL